MTNAALAKHQRLVRLERAAGAAFGHAVVEEAAGRASDTRAAAPTGHPLLARLAALFGTPSDATGAARVALHPR